MFAGDWLASRLINQILLGVFVVLTLVTPQFAEKILGMAVYIALLQYCRDLPLDRRVITASFWLLAAFAVAVIFSYNTYVSSVFLSVYASYFVLMVVAAVFIDSREKLTGVCTFLAVAVILIDCYALWQFISGENTSLIGVDGGGTRLIGGTSNPIIFSGYLFNVITLFLVLGLKAVPGIPPKHKKLFFLTALFSLAILILTLTRGGWLALEAVMLVWIGFEWKRDRKLVAILFLIALLLFVNMAGIMPGLLQGMAERPQVVEQGVVADPSSMQRIVMWQAAWQIFLDHPLAGAGLYQFHDMFYGKYYPSTAVSLDKLWQNAHSDYFNLLAETGILGTTAYIYFFGTLLWSKYRRYRLNPEDIWSMLGLLLTMGFLLEGLTYQYFGLATNMWLFFIIIGLTDAAAARPVPVSEGREKAATEGVEREYTG
ncbi:MAG: O-antigen ligase family protein [Negativicutes bacterium]|nr:O-antigen ligase family protein [Negativicutes bacterium]